MDQKQPIKDSPRWCGICKEYGDHHTDRCSLTMRQRLERRRDVERDLYERLAAT